MIKRHKRLAVCICRVYLCICVFLYYWIFVFLYFCIIGFFWSSRTRGCPPLHRILYLCISFFFIFLLDCIWVFLFLYFLQNCICVFFCIFARLYFYRTQVSWSYLCVWLSLSTTPSVNLTDMTLADKETNLILRDVFLNKNVCFL